MRIVNLLITGLLCFAFGCPTNASIPAANGSDTMSPGFSKARSKFTEYAAAQLKVRPGKVQVTPSDEAVANMPHMNPIGPLWRFQASLDTQEVNGWANADGVVVSPSQNLGLLFQAAGLWSGSPKLDAGQLAEQLTWALGTSYKLLGPPEMNRNPDGSGTLRFELSYAPPGPGRSPPMRSEVTVTFSPDHKAALTRTAPHFIAP